MRINQLPAHLLVAGTGQKKESDGGGSNWRQAGIIWRNRELGTLGAERFPECQSRYHQLGLLLGIVCNDCHDTGNAVKTPIAGNM